MALLSRVIRHQTTTITAARNPFLLLSGSPPSIVVRSAINNRSSKTLFNHCHPSLLFHNHDHHYHHTTTTTFAMSQQQQQQQQQHFFKLSMCQLNVTHDKQLNIENATSAIRQSAAQGAQLIVLPECFNCPYGNKYFADYAENLESSQTLKHISQMAKELGVYIIAGSIPTTSPKQKEKFYNTSVVFDNQGNQIAVHNKVHLFDINVPNKIVFQESAVLTAGNELTTFDMTIRSSSSSNDDDSQSTRTVKVGLGICFDIRFPEMAQLYQRQGCELLVYPGAFNMTTGPAHWELLCRSRAVDNQLFVCVVSPARDTSADYVAYGHSMLCTPWGDKLVEMDEKPGVAIANVQIDQCQEIRDQIPSIKNRRLDLYNVVQVSQNNKNN